MIFNIEKMHVAARKYMFRSRKFRGARIWCHAKMRGRGASKNGLERKPGPWWSGENFSGCPWLQVSLHPFMAPLNSIQLLIESRAQFRKMKLEKDSSKKGEQYYEKVEKRKRRKMKNKNIEKECRGLKN